MTHSRKSELPESIECVIKHFFFLICKIPITTMRNTDDRVTLINTNRSLGHLAPSQVYRRYLMIHKNGH